MELKVYNIQGKELKSITVPDGIYAVPMNAGVLHAVVKAYRANRRQGTAMVKNRSLVSGGGKKPFKQKGTGGARQGSSRGNHMPGGGQAHGPLPRSYRHGLSKKQRQLALKVALSDKVRHGKLIVINDFAIEKCSTKHVCGVLKALKTEKALLADERKDDFLYKSARNIYGAAALSASEINAENVLRYDSLVISEHALTSLQQRLAKEVQA